MYNRKSKTSAILAFITAVLLIGFMILFPFLRYNTENDISLAEAVMVFCSRTIGYTTICSGAICFIIIALNLGIKMLKQQSHKQLISLNVSMLISTCVLLPFLAVGMIGCSGLIFQSTFQLFPIIYTIIVSLFYIACAITQIVTIVKLKKSPEENTPATTK